MASKRKATFEQKTALLEQYVQQLENGGLSLDESLKVYENGLSLVNELESELSKAQQKISILKKQTDGSLMEEPFTEVPYEEL